MFLDSMNDLKTLFPGRWNAPTAPQTAGNLIFNANECVALDTGPVDFHNVCDDDDGNDVFFYKATPMLNFNQTLNNSDEPSIEITIYAEPDETGNVYRLGSSSLTERQIYDPETQTFVDVA